MNSLVRQSMVSYMYHLQLYILIYKFILHAPAIRPGAGMQPAARRGMQPAARRGMLPAARRRLQGVRNTSWARRRLLGHVREKTKGQKGPIKSKYKYLVVKRNKKESKSYCSNVSAFGVLL
jgi:hypothetical protein